MSVTAFFILPQRRVCRPSPPGMSFDKGHPKSQQKTFPSLSPKGQQKFRVSLASWTSFMGVIAGQGGTSFISCPQTNRSGGVKLDRFGPSARHTSVCAPLMMALVKIMTSTEASLLLLPFVKVGQIDQAHLSSNTKERNRGL